MISRLSSNFGAIEVICKGVNWITLPLVAFLVPPERYGAVVLSYTIITVVSTLVLFGQGRSILKFYDKKENWITTSTTIILGISAASFLGTAYIFEIENPALITLISFLLATHAALSLKLRTIHEKEEYLILRFSHTMLRLTLVPAIVVISPSITHYLAAEAAAIIGSLALSRKTLISTISEIRKIPPENFIRTAKMGAPLFLQAMCSLAIANLDKIIIAQKIGEAALGQYAFIFSMASSLAFINAYYSMQHEAEIYKSPNFECAKEKASIFSKKLILANLAVSPFLFAAYLATPFLSDNIQSAPSTFLVILASQIMAGAALRGSYLSTYKEETGTILVVSIFCALTNTALNYLLIPNYGLNGAATASLASNCTLALLINISAHQNRKKTQHKNPTKSE